VERGRYDVIFKFLIFLILGGVTVKYRLSLFFPPQAENFLGAGFVLSGGKKCCVGKSVQRWYGARAYLCMVKK
jgi:hypothetical protein